MDDRSTSISPDALYTRVGSEAAPIIVDVRRDADFAGADRLVAEAFHRSPENVEQWLTDLPNGRQTVTYFNPRLEITQRVAVPMRPKGPYGPFLEGRLS